MPITWLQGVSPSIPSCDPDKVAEGQTEPGKPYSAADESNATIYKSLMKTSLWANKKITPSLFSLVLGAYCTVCTRCAQSLNRTMPKLHSSA